MEKGYKNSPTDDDGEVHFTAEIEKTFKVEKMEINMFSARRSSEVFQNMVQHK